MHVQLENIPYPRSLSHHQMIQVQHKKKLTVIVIKKNEIWTELEDMSPQKKKFTDKSYDITPKTKKPQQQRRQRMKMEKSQFKCTVILKKL